MRHYRMNNVKGRIECVELPDDAPLVKGGQGREPSDGEFSFGWAAALTVIGGAIIIVLAGVGAAWCMGVMK